MAPKRTAKVVGSVLRTTKKVVEEIVQVSAVVSAGDSQENVEIPPAGEKSKVVEVVVEEKESQVPINIVTSLPDSQSDEQPEKPAAEANKGKQEEKEPSKEKKKADATADQERREKEAKEAEAINKEEEEMANQRKEAESIADKETQGEEEETDREKKEEPRTPKKVEQLPQRDQEKQMGEEDKEGNEEKGKPKRGRRAAAAAAAGGRGAKKRRAKRYSGGGGIGEMDGVGRGYKRYVFKVLKQVHPDLGVSARAMAVLDSMMGDMFERLADEAARLSRYTGKATLSSREIQGAVKMVLPGELSKHAISEGTKAVSNYMAAERGE